MTLVFGLAVDPATACRQAMRAAANVAANVEYMNHQFATELREPIRIRHRDSGRRGHYRGHRFSRPYGVHRDRRCGKRRGAAAGHDQDAQLHDHRVGGSLQDVGHLAR